MSNNSFLTRRSTMIACAGFAMLMMPFATANAQSISDLEAAAKTEGQIVSLGMPDDWANWGEMWKAIMGKYGVTHADTDLSSAEQLAKFEAEGANASADICEVGLEFMPVAVKKGLSQPYKTKNWDKIPDWAKDKDGNWAFSYTGTIAFVINKNIKNPPRSFADLATGDYKITVGEVGKRAAANAAVLAAAIALGGSETNLQPGLDLYAKLAKQNRLLTINPTVALMEKGEIQVGIVFDFNALSWRDVAGKEKWDVLIPSDGSVTTGYSTIINAFAKRPNIAKLTREFAFSDEGQAMFAKGYARPILIDGLNLSSEAAAHLLPSEQYRNAKPINPETWPGAAKKLGTMWQEQVASKM